MSRKPKAAPVVHERPRGGGSYVRKPDGKLDKVEGTEPLAPFASRETADAEPAQTIETTDEGPPGGVDPITQGQEG